MKKTLQWIIVATLSALLQGDEPKVDVSHEATPVVVVIVDRCDNTL